MRILSCSLYTSWYNLKNDGENKKLRFYDAEDAIVIENSLQKKIQVDRVIWLPFSGSLNSTSLKEGENWKIKP